MGYNSDFHDVMYWRQMPLSSADEVMSNIPSVERAHKSEFRNLAIDLSGFVSTAFARTPAQKRVDFSVIACDPEKIDMFAGYLSWLKEDSEREKMSYKIGYVREGSAGGKPRLIYVCLEFNGQKIEDHLF